MDKDEFAARVLDSVCSYVGDDKVFETLIDRWGIETVFDIVSKLFEAKQQIVGPVEEEVATDGEDDD